MKLWILALTLTTTAPGQDLESLLDAAKKLPPQQTRASVEKLLPKLRTSGNPKVLVRALNLCAQASYNLADYETTLRYTGESLKLSRQSGDTAGEAHAENLSGLVHTYRADYGSAAGHVRRAIDLFQKAGDSENLVYAQNNLGNIAYFEGRYLDALKAYQAASALALHNPSVSWFEEAYQFSSSNLAMLYQRLGRDEAALNIYLTLRNTDKALAPRDEAISLLNQGALYRRLGDPVKAIAMYERAGELAKQARYLTGQMSATRNFGIAQALEFGNFTTATKAFTEVLIRAQSAGNRREELHAWLYLGETHFRDGYDDRAESTWRRALALARQLGTAEEEWKSLYGLGRVAERMADSAKARKHFEEAISVIESVRARLQLSSLRPEFLSDKRDVYDSLIGLLATPAAQPGSDGRIFQLLESVRARTLRERIAQQAEAQRPELKQLRAEISKAYAKRQTARPADAKNLDAEIAALEGEFTRKEPVIPGTRGDATIEGIRERLAQDTALVSYWLGPQQIGILWLTRKEAGHVVRPFGSENRTKLTQFLAEVRRPGSPGVEALADEVGDDLLDFPPDQGIRKLIIVPDGVLAAVPFEALRVDGKYLVEDYEVAYLPAAALFLREAARRLWLPPWAQQLAAFGDPLAQLKNADQHLMPGDERWARLPRSADEVRAVAALMPGKSRVYVGPEARKKTLLDMRSVPVLHLATHAAANEDSPQQSRILLAAAPPETGVDYLFLTEAPLLDLGATDLVTLSACETERGRMVRGEGVQSFGHALLASGARTTLTSLWPVSDHGTAELMKQFYFRAGRGASKAAALRAAKLKFIHSNSVLRHPAHWAAFVLNGDAFTPLPLAARWSSLMLPAAGGLIALAAVVVLRKRRS